MYFFITRLDGYGLRIFEFTPNYNSNKNDGATRGASACAARARPQIRNPKSKIIPRNQQGKMIMPS